MEAIMTIQEVLVLAEREAEARGIEITIPAVLQFGDLEDITYTFSLYGEDEFAEEIKNRYINAEREAYREAVAA
jgi:hypothetical protein